MNEVTQCAGPVHMHVYASNRECAYMNVNRERERLVHVQCTCIYMKTSVPTTVYMYM